MNALQMALLGGVLLGIPIGFGARAGFAWLAMRVGASDPSPPGPRRKPRVFPL